MFRDFVFAFQRWSLNLRCVTNNACAGKLNISTKKVRANSGGSKYGRRFVELRNEHNHESDISVITFVD